MLSEPKSPPGTEHRARRRLTASREEHSSWAPKGLQRFTSKEIFMEGRC